MSDTRATIEIAGSDVSEELLRGGAQIEVEEAIGEPDAASVTVAVEATKDGEWPSPIDQLAAPGAELRVRVEHDDETYTFDGSAVGATTSRRLGDRLKKPRRPFARLPGFDLYETALRGLSRGRRLRLPCGRLWVSRRSRRRWSEAAWRRWRRFAGPSA